MSSGSLKYWLCVLLPWRSESKLVCFCGQRVCYKTEYCFFWFQILTAFHQAPKNFLQPYVLVFSPVTPLVSPLGLNWSSLGSVCCLLLNLFPFLWPIHLQDVEFLYVTVCYRVWRHISVTLRADSRWRQSDWSGHAPCQRMLMQHLPVCQKGVNLQVGEEQYSLLDEPDSEN